MEVDRHALNIFMARILFCLFSDDVGIFDKDVFETAVRQSNVDGSDLAAFLDSAFKYMDTPPEKRSSETRPWSKLKYVNGSLFEEDVPMPALDGRCRKLLLDCAGLNWKLINPDIFGSMLQAVVDVEKRGELGMHYTSPANIMKVLEPILLDSLQAELERAGANKGRLRDFLERLGRIRVFDPACGSGNFLILAYKELRALETEALRRLATPRLSGIALEQFFGIEIDDFACQAARLGLWIAKYQCDQQRTGPRPAHRLPAAPEGRRDRDRQRGRERLAGGLPRSRARRRSWSGIRSSAVHLTGRPSRRRIWPASSRGASRTGAISTT